MPLKLLAVTAAIVAFVCMEADWSRGAIDATASRVTCSKVASTLGSNSYTGTATRPYLTIEKLVSSLRPGQTGCLRTGVFNRDVVISKGGTVSAPITITSYPGERATVLGRVQVTDQANNVVLQQLTLDGYNDAGLPSPTVNGDNVVFRDDDVSNRNTTICFLLGSDEWGRARGTVIERSRIHNCGQLPPTNHHHGIYVEASDGARITDNWIYDNADRGIQLFPDAQSTYIARNVIAAHGEGIVFSRESSNNLAENNVISNPVLRYNIEEWELTGSGNMARRNCIWSTRHGGPGGLQPGLHVATVENKVTEPGFVNRADKDFRLRADSPCLDFSPSPQPAEKRSPRKRGAVSLSSDTARVWPGGRLRLRAKVVSEGARASAAKQAVLKVRRGKRWRRVGTMRLRAGRYLYRAHVGRGHGSLRRFGGVRVKRGVRVLRLRAYVQGAGHSNVVRIRLGR